MLLEQYGHFNKLEVTFLCIVQEYKTLLKRYSYLKTFPKLVGLGRCN